MSDISIKKLVIEVDGEAAMVFTVPSVNNGERFQMVEAALASNPVLRFVDTAEVGDVWDGTTFTPPV